jgi:hypothetical protein
VDCPFCEVVDPMRGPGPRSLPGWVFITACFLTSPLSIPFVLRAPGLGRGARALAISGALLWALAVGLWYV